ncbi:membrane-spanning 4-domains subfamily A member 15-like [Pelodiscus sinensis]|uniref:membrane-spanning 4-domains subfamily A member 15-like n=1 Tax=Pelodiscus sinensis TaxID=13735 RepID=UPI000D723364|nr:membrane-spanning 4-domains subfamily A member 15-like [Pelodiscus sinensis]|eukprot:XP_025042105.1 membrane-spanning 4-domains subfamily A member 15-like [Pelodiscus sinensis]
MATPGSMANEALVFMPPNSTGITQQAQGASGAISQTPQVMQYEPQQFRVMDPWNQPLGSMYPESAGEQVAQLRKAGMMEIFLKAQPKTMGALQILTGLMTIGFGGISTIFMKRPTFISAFTGYPFWGGIFFVIAGSLSVAAENHPRTWLVRSNQKINNTSATVSSFGIIILIADLILNPSRYDNHEEYLWWSARTGITVMLLFMTVLEFCIAVSTSYVAKQAIGYTPDTSMLYMPYAVNTNFGVPSAPMPPPPPYTNEAYDPKEETEEGASGGSPVRDGASSSFSEK